MIFYFDDGYSGIYSNMQTYYYEYDYLIFFYMCYTLITSKPLPPGGLVNKKKKKKVKKCCSVSEKITKYL